MFQQQNNFLFKKPDQMQDSCPIKNIVQFKQGSNNVCTKNLDSLSSPQKNQFQQKNQYNSPNVPEGKQQQQFVGQTNELNTKAQFSPIRRQNGSDNCTLLQATPMQKNQEIQQKQKYINEFKELKEMLLIKYNNRQQNQLKEQMLINTQYD